MEFAERIGSEARDDEPQMTMGSEKGKKKRTMFSSDQKSMLETQFTTNPYPDKQARKRLADELSVKDKSIDYWFGHRRAKNAKAKKVASAVDGDSSSPSVADDMSSPLSSSDMLGSPVTVGLVAISDSSMHPHTPRLSDFDDCHDIFRNAGPMASLLSMHHSEDSPVEDMTDHRLFSDILDGQLFHPLPMNENSLGLSDLYHAESSLESHFNF
jgi:hypothetical protein